MVWIHFSTLNFFSQNCPSSRWAKIWTSIIWCPGRRNFQKTAIFKRKNRKNAFPTKNRKGIFFSKKLGVRYWTLTFSLPFCNQRNCQSECNLIHNKLHSKPIGKIHKLTHSNEQMKPYGNWICIVTIGSRLKKWFIKRKNYRVIFFCYYN